MIQTLRTRGLRMFLGAAAIFVVGAGVAWAAIPGSDARRGQVVLDGNASEADDLADNGHEAGAPGTRAGVRLI